MDLGAWKVLLMTALLVIDVSYGHKKAQRGKRKKNSPKTQWGPYKFIYSRNHPHAKLYGKTGLGNDVDEEKNWPPLCRTGKAQSPVDIQTKILDNVVKPPIVMRGFDQKSTKTTICNHHGMYVKVNPVFKTPVTITGGPFGKEKFYFNQFHFHWGQSGYAGSEHAINGIKSPLEAHFVFFKEGLDMMKAPFTYGGVAVLTVLYDLDINNNPAFEPIMNVLRSKKIEMPNQEAESKPINLKDFLPKDLTSYITYVGSLTTPGCTEGVRFVIFSKKERIASRQVKEFSRTKKLDGKWNLRNWRQIKPRNGRKIEKVKTK